jgi:hypothetical protein
MSKAAESMASIRQEITSNSTCKTFLLWIGYFCLISNLDEFLIPKK